MARSYRLEYDRYHSKPKQKKDRAARNTARRRVKKSSGIQAGKDVHHKDGNPRNNSPSNLTVSSRASNRNQSPGRPKGKKDSTPRRKRGKKK